MHRNASETAICDYIAETQRTNQEQQTGNTQTQCYTMQDRYNGMDQGYQGQFLNQTVHFNLTEMSRRIDWLLQEREYMVREIEELKQNLATSRTQCQDLLIQRKQEIHTVRDKLMESHLLLRDQVMNITATTRILNWAATVLGGTVLTGLAGLIISKLAP